MEAFAQQYEQPGDLSLKWIICGYLMDGSNIRVGDICSFQCSLQTACEPRQTPVPTVMGFTGWLQVAVQIQEDGSEFTGGQHQVKAGRGFVRKVPVL